MSNDGPEVEPRVKGVQIERGNDQPDLEPDEGEPEPDDPGDESIDPGDEPADAGDDPSDSGDSPGGDPADENGGPAPNADTNDPGESGADDSDGDDDGLGTTVVLVPGDPVTTFERDVDFVTITEDDLPVRQVGSAESSAMTFGWNDSAGAVTSATSSSTTVDGVADLSTQISSEGPGMRLTVSLTNVAQETRVGLRGRLAVEVKTGGGTHVFRGQAVDAVVNPDGGTTASFIFRLPSGSYSARALFLPS